MPSESVNSRCAAPIRVEVAKFEDWDPAGRGFDAVVAAQAWHWVNPVAGAAKAAAVLRPGARLAVFWNAFDPPEDLRVAFGDVFRRVLPDSPIAGFWDRPRRRGLPGRVPQGGRGAPAGGTFTMSYTTIAATAVRLVS